jgi:hypothetical protein
VKVRIGLEGWQVDHPDVRRRHLPQLIGEWSPSIDEPDLKLGQPMQKRQAAHEVAEAQNRLAVEDQAWPHD